MNVADRREVCRKALESLRNRKSFACVYISDERIQAVIALEKMRKNPRNNVVEGEVMVALLVLEGYLEKLGKKESVKVIRNILEDLFLRPSLD